MVELWHGWKRAHEAVLSGVGRELQARADSMGWDKSRLSHQLSRMEERGLLERRREGAKLVQVRITRRGRVALGAAREAHAAAVRRCLLDAIPAVERPRLLALLRRLTASE